MRSRSGRGGGWGAREAHEEKELAGSELAGVFARSNSETWPAVLGSFYVVERRPETSSGGESPNLTSAESARFAGRSAFVLLQRC